MWNERYSQEGYVYGTEPNEFLRDHLSYLTTGPILSLCEGEGRNAVFLASKGFEVTGVDGSEVGLQKAHRLAQERGVTIQTVVADMAHYTPAANTYGAVVAIFAHVPSEVRKRIFRLAVQALKDGGIFLLEAYTPAQLSYNTGGPKELDRLVTLADLKADLNDCNFLIGRETTRLILDGKFHTGEGSVVQVIAQKSNAKRL